MKQRLIFFDLLRIFAISLVVACHIVQYRFIGHWWSYEPWMQYFIDHPRILEIDLNVGTIGVLIFLFVSGAVLELNYPNLDSLKKYAGFIAGRIIRIYPAFWITFSLMAVFCMERLINSSPFDIFISVAGFSEFFGLHNGVLGGVFFTTFWFIGLIIVFYFLFPFLSFILKRWPEFLLGASLLMFLFVVSDPHTIQYNLPMFILGMYVIHRGLYPKTLSESRVIFFLSELSFYVFLVHYSIPAIWGMYYSSIPVYLIIVIAISWWIMVIDSKIQGVFLKKKVL